jgi:hypothetical protein
MLEPIPIAPKGEEYLIILFDLRRPGAEERLRRELASWGGFASAERLARDHIALVVRPGGVLGISQ